VLSYDAMAHAWIIRFLGHRIADKRILRLIAKWLKVGIIEDGRVTRSKVGAPQGAVISPILANVYLHYAYDLWVQSRRTNADDTIVGFEHEHEAKAFLHDLHERLRAFELALHPDKTRLSRFGRQAAEQRAARGEGKPETFDFLGFTHFCTRSRNWGTFVIGRKTIKKRLLGAGEGALGVDEPVRLPQRAEIGLEGFGIGEMLIVAEELQAIGVVRLNQHSQHAAAEEGGEDLDGHKIIGSGGDPARSVR